MKNKILDSKDSLLTFVVVGLLLFLLAHFVIPLKFIKAISDDFNKVAIGIAALVTAYFGSSYFIEEWSRQRQIDLYRKNYPHDKYGKTWKIVVRKDRTGEPHVLDIGTLTKHHIWNMKTIFDLGWQFYNREAVDIQRFDSYHIGEKIRTRGELGE